MISSAPCVNGELQWWERPLYDEGDDLLQGPDCDSEGAARALKLEPGAEVALEIQDERLVIQRVEPGLPDWRTMRGMLRNGSSLTQALEEEHREELAREDQRLGRL